MQQNNAADPLERLIQSLAREVSEGRAHLYVGRHLTNELIRNPHIYNTARTFFSLSIHAHMVEAFLHLGRLFDKKRGVLKLRNLLDEALKHAGRFQRARPEEVRVLAGTLSHTIDELEKRIGPARNRRNNLLAHLDPRAAFDPNAFEKEARITFGEMEDIYENSGNVVNEVYQEYRGATVLMEVIGADDFRRLIALANRGWTADSQQGGGPPSRL